MSEANQRRTCRACGQSYDYPGHQSMATRTYCENCIELPEPARRNFEPCAAGWIAEKSLAEIKSQQS